MKTVERYARWTILIAALVVLAGLSGRLKQLWQVNRMAIEQMRGKTQAAAGLPGKSEWFLPDYVSGRGRSLEGSFAAAIPLLERASVHRPDHPSLLLELGLAHLRGGSFEEGVGYLRRVPGIEGRADFNYLLHQGWEQVLANRDLPVEERDWSAAERFYRAALRLSLEERQVYRALVEFYVYWSKDPVEAENALQAAEVRFPEWDVRGRYSSSMGAPEPKDAATSAEKFDPAPLLTPPRSVSIQPGVWTDTVLIQETQGDIHTPVIVADARGGVHCLWIEQTKGHASPESRILHSRLVEGKWSRPAFLHRDSWAAFLWVTATSSGSLVAAWSAPNGELLTSELMAGSPGLTGGWGPARPLARGRGNLQMIEDGRSLHVVYPFRGTILLRTSRDGGKQWSSGTTIREQNQESNPDYAAIGVDSRTSLHVLWTEFALPKGWPPRGILYRRSGDLGKSWSQPFRLVGPGFDQAGLSVGPDDTLHVAYNGMAGTGGRYHITSTDGGLNWSAPAQITPQGATEGTPQMVFDGKGGLHLLTTGFTRVLYSRLQEGQWLQPMQLAGGESRDSYWHEQASLCIVDGRVLHVAYWDHRKKLYHRMFLPER